jgi:hypothetical protein
LKSLFFTFLLAFSTQSFANSAKIWQSYFPNASCGSSCASGVPADALEEALGKIKYVSPSTLKKAKHIFVVDFSQNSKNKRGYLINTKNGVVNRYHVSHGIGSDDGRGNAVRFSNKPESNMSSLGLYIGAETYSGKHGLSLRLDGKEKTNSKARERAIVIHGADYARDNFIKKSGYTGRSHGCPAVDDRLSKALIDKLKGGGAIYIYN